MRNGRSLEEGSEKEREDGDLILLGRDKKGEKGNNAAAGKNVCACMCQH